VIVQQILPAKLLGSMTKGVLPALSSARSTSRSPKSSTPLISFFCFRVDQLCIKGQQWGLWITLPLWDILAQVRPTQACHEGMVDQCGAVGGDLAAAAVVPWYPLMIKPGPTSLSVAECCLAESASVPVAHFATCPLLLLQHSQILQTTSWT
jgi:hypothetical protein